VTLIGYRENFFLIKVDKVYLENNPMNEKKLRFLIGLSYELGCT